MLQLDPRTLRWTTLAHSPPNAAGDPAAIPPPRCSASVAFAGTAANASLYVFGGLTGVGSPPTSPHITFRVGLSSALAPAPSRSQSSARSSAAGYPPSASPGSPRTSGKNHPSRSRHTWGQARLGSLALLSARRSFLFVSAILRRILASPRACLTAGTRRLVLIRQMSIQAAGRL